MPYNIPKKFFLLFAALALVAGIQTAEAAKWTFMVYLDADNDLEAAGIDDMNEMELAGSTDDVNIIVQIDRVPGHDNTNGDWTECRRYRITKDNDPSEIKSELLQQMGEVNMGNPKTLSDFIKWGVANYPADHYIIVLWNHGGGWKNSGNLGNGIRISKPLSGDRVFSVSNLLKPPAGAKRKEAEFFPNPFKSGAGYSKDICFDDTDNDHLSSKEVSEALASSGQKPDILGYDACLMAMFENAYQVKGLADFMVGSEELEPGDGWPYDKILQPLLANADMNPESMSKNIVAQYGLYYNQLDDKTTQSAIRLSETDALASAIESFTTAVKNANDWQAVAKAHAETENFNQYKYIDLGHFAKNVMGRLPGPDVQSGANALISALDKAVIANYTGAAFPNSKGLSIYAPQASSYEAAYGTNSFNIDFIANSSWADFLQEFYEGAGGELSEVFGNDKYEPNNNWALSYRLGAESIQAYIEYVNDVDFFRIETGGADVTVTLTPPAGADFDLIFAQINGDEIEILAESVNFGDEIDEVYMKGLPQGIYYAVIQASEQGLTSVAPYSLDISGPNIFAPPYYRRTMAYDYGEYGDIFEISSAKNEGAVCLFSPPKAPAKLVRIWYFVSSMATVPGMGMDGSFYYYAFDFYGPLVDDGLGNPVLGTPPGEGWVFVDVSDRDIMIYDEFAVGLMWDGWNTPAFGYDTTDSFGTNLIFADLFGLGESWYQAPGTFYIRAELEYGDPATGTGEAVLVGPAGLKAGQNFPNPAKDYTVINYTAGAPSEISLYVYTATGSLALSKSLGFKSPGNYSYMLDVSGLPSGNYSYILKGGGMQEVKKMTVIR